MERGLGAKAGANLPQSAEETLLVECRRDGTTRIALDAKASWLGVGREMGALLRRDQGCVGASRDPKDPCLLLSDPTTVCSARCLFG